MFGLFEDADTFLNVLLLKLIFLVCHGFDNLEDIFGLVVYFFHHLQILLFLQLIKLFALFQ